MSSMLDIPGVRDSALRLNVDQYHQLCAAGIIPEKTELLSGIVVRKMGKSPLHTWTVTFLADWLRTRLPSHRSLRIEQPLTLEDSEPEPDLAIVRGSRDDYRAAHPTTALLVIEVAISTEEIDRAKTAIYAVAEVGEYWLVVPARRQVVVHRGANRAEGAFGEVTIVERQGQLVWANEALLCADLFPDT